MAELCTLKRLGLVLEHAAGICVLTDAGRRCLHIGMPSRGPTTAS